MDSTNRITDPTTHRTGNSGSFEDFSLTNRIREQENIPLISRSHESSTEQDSANDETVLPPPSTQGDDFDAGNLRSKLEGPFGGFDIFNIFAVVHEILAEMRRQASESKQDAYLAQWTAFEAKAEKIVSAAKKDFTAAMVNGGMSMAGGMCGMRAGYSAAKQTRNAMKLETDVPKTPQIGLDDVSPTRPTTDLSPDQAVPGPNAQAKSSDAGNPPPADKKDAATDTPPRENIQFKQQAMITQAQNTTNTGMALGQFFTGMGSIISSIPTYFAELDRAAKERDEADATKAQADVESEADFVRSAAEGEKAIRDSMEQFITSRSQINIKLMA